MDTFDCVAAVAVGIITIGLASVAIPNMREAKQRSRQRFTMSAVQTLAKRIEQGDSSTAITDGWGNPVRVRRSGQKPVSGRRWPETGPENV